MCRVHIEMTTHNQESIFKRGPPIGHLLQHVSCLSVTSDSDIRLGLLIHPSKCSCRPDNRSRTVETCLRHTRRLVFTFHVYHYNKQANYHVMITVCHVSVEKLSFPTLPPVLCHLTYSRNLASKIDLTLFKCQHGDVK